MKKIYIYVIFITSIVHGMKPSYYIYIKNEKFFLENYLKKKNAKELIKHLEKSDTQEYVKSKKNLLSWVLKRTDECELINHFIKVGMILHSDLNALKSLLELYFKKENNQGLCLCVENPSVSELIRSDQNFFTWIKEKFDDPFLLKMLISNGCVPDKLHSIVIEEIEKKESLQKYFSCLDDKKIIEYLKKEEVKKYISTDKKLLLWAAKKTKDPFIIKHLVDFGVNIDFDSSSGPNSVFELVAEKQYFHHYDLLFAIIARHIYEKNVYEDTKLLSEILGKDYTKTAHDDRVFLRLIIENQNKKTSEKKHQKNSTIFKLPNLTLFEIAHTKQNELRKQFVIKHNQEDSCYPKFIMDPAIKEFLQNKYQETVTKCTKKAQEYLDHLKFMEKNIILLNAIIIKEQLQPWKNRAEAIELINPQLWNSENFLRGVLIKKILEYRKKHNYDSFERPYSIKGGCFYNYIYKGSSPLNLRNASHDEECIDIDPLEKFSNWLMSEETKFKALRDDELKEK